MRFELAGMNLETGLIFTDAFTEMVDNFYKETQQELKDIHKLNRLSIDSNAPMKKTDKETSTETEKNKSSIISNHIIDNSKYRLSVIPCIKIRTKFKRTLNFQALSLIRGPA